MIFLEWTVAGIEYDLGYYVFCGLMGSDALLSLLEEDDDGELCATDKIFIIDAADLDNFSRNNLSIVANETRQK